MPRDYSIPGSTPAKEITLATARLFPCLVLNQAGARVLIEEGQIDPLIAALQDLRRHLNAGATVLPFPGGNHG